VTINAECNGAPTISAVMPTVVDVWDTVVLDASGTVDPDGDVLSYRWNVELCNGTYNFNQYLLNSRSSKVMFLPENPGNYCVSLEVSDGCTDATGAWIFEATCNKTQMTAPRELKIDAKFEGLGVQVVKIGVEEQKGVERDQKWYNTQEYTWRLVGFTAADKYKAALSGGQIAGIVIGALAAAAVVIAAVIGLIWYIRKRLDGTVSTARSSGDGAGKTAGGRCGLFGLRGFFESIRMRFKATGAASSAASSAGGGIATEVEKAEVELTPSADPSV